MKRILLVVVTLLSINIGFGQVTTIDFETLGSGYTTSITPYGSGTTDLFNRTNTTNNGNSTFYWGAEDLASGNPSIDINQIDISGSSEFVFSIDISYDNAGAWDASDEFLITYSIDGGTYQNLLWVQHINSDGFNNPAALDLNFDGNGDLGQELSTSSFITYTTSAITLSSNSTLDINLQYNVLTSGGEGIFVDNIIITETAGSTDTEVELASAAYSASENGTSVMICADITNESATSATSADLVLTSSGTPHLTSYSTTGITFPAASSAQQCVTVIIADDATCDGGVNYDFELQNVTGGTSATVGTQNSTQLSISDDEMVSGTIVSQSFEGSGTWSYTSNVGHPINGYDLLNGDEWHIVSSLGGMTPTDGSNMWAFQDIDNASHSGDHSLEFSSYDISSSLGVQLSFDWEAVALNSTDEIGYEINIDATGWVRTSLCTGCGSASGPITIPISDVSTSIQLRLYGFQNGGSQYGGFDNIVLTGDVCPAACAEPTTDAVFQPSSPTLITETSANLNSNVGDGDSRIVVLKETSAITFVPVDNTTYVANNSFGSGVDVGTGEYVVYNGSSNTVSVSNLTPGTEYYSTIYEYGCTPGLEDYFTSGTAALDTFITIPENPVSFTEGCTGAAILELSWSAPSSGNFDGYLLVAREAASPQAVSSLDPNTQTFDLDYSLAPTYGVGGASRVLYNGTGTTASVTGLTNGLSYTFEVLTYTIGTVEFTYSSGTTTSQVIEIQNVSGQAASGSDMQAEVVWVNPSALCFDEILVVVNETSGIDFMPTGDGTAYVANSVYAGVNQVVYKGTGLTETTTTLTNGTTYYFEIFVRSGTEWSSGVEVSVVPNTATIFEPGDMAIIAFNTSNSSNEDEFCFFAYKDITEGTSIDFTDNGYGRVNDGEWGDTEGVIRLTRNSGGTILAGTVICIQGNGNDDTDFEIYNCGVLDDANWSVTSLNGPTFFFNFNGTDQVWIMQGGSWVNPSGSHNASYTGNLTYGFTATGWEVAHGYSSTSGSQLYEGTECYNTDVDGVANSDKVKYTGPMTITDQRTWIGRINNSANWTGYSSNANYNSGGSDYIGSCIVFPIDNSSGFAEGTWEGDIDNNWFNCANWQDLKVPDETVDVVIQNTATNEANFDNANTFASLYDGVAKCKDLTIEDNIWVEGISNLDTIKIFGNLVIEDDAILDLNGTVTGAVIELGGHFTNNDPNDDAFDQDKSLVILNGIAQQDITTAHSSGKEDFYNLILDKTAQTKVNLNDDLEVANVLSFESGIIKTNTSKVYVSAGNIGDIIGYEAPNGTGTYSNDKFVEGNLEREISSAMTYDFPVGDDYMALGYNPIVLTVQSGMGSATGKFVNGAPGSINVYDVTQNCSGTPVLISYTTMTGLGSWNFTSATTFSYDVMLHANTANTNTSPNSDGQYRALKAPTGTAGGTWPVASATDGDFCIVSSNYYAIPGVGYTGFSDFGVGGGTGGPALPVELLYFNAKSIDKLVQLNWATVTEINNDFFTLERSKNGQDFEAIGTVQGAGNYNGKLDYNFLDEKPFEGISYYRLRQTDFDGSFEYSEIKIVNRVSQTFEIGNLYPNPVNDNLFVPISSIENELVHVKIFDVTGRVVLSETFKVITQTNQLQLNASNLLSGIYVLNIETKNASRKINFVKK